LDDAKAGANSRFILVAAFVVYIGIFGRVIVQFVTTPASNVVPVNVPLTPVDIWILQFVTTPSLSVVEVKVPPWPVAKFT